MKDSRTCPLSPLNPSSRTHSQQPPSPAPPPFPRSLTLSRLAPRRGKKQVKRNLPQLMTAARHQLRRAMPASVLSRLPASYLRVGILQPPPNPVKRAMSSEMKDPVQARDPLVLVRGAEMNRKASFESADGLGFIFLSGFFFGQFFWLSVWFTSAIPIFTGTRGGHCEETGVPRAG